MRKIITGALFCLMVISSSAARAANSNNFFNRPRAARNGIGLSSMLDYGQARGNFASGINLRLRAIDYTPLELEGGLFINKGFYLKLNSYKLYISDWFFLHLIDFGLMKWQNQATAFNNPAEARRFDIIIASGVEARLWRHLTLAVDVGWYFPNPGDILTRAKNEIEHAFDQPMGNNPVNQDEAEKRVEAAIEHIGDVYLNAAKDVHLAVGLRWYF